MRDDTSARQVLCLLAEDPVHRTRYILKLLLDYKSTRPLGMELIRANWMIWALSLGPTHFTQVLKHRIAAGTTKDEIAHAVVSHKMNGQNVMECVCANGNWEALNAIRGALGSRRVIDMLDDDLMTKIVEYNASHNHPLGWLVHAICCVDAKGKARSHLKAKVETFLAKYVYASLLWYDNLAQVLRYFTNTFHSHVRLPAEIWGYILTRVSGREDSLIHTLSFMRDAEALPLPDMVVDKYGRDLVRSHVVGPQAKDPSIVRSIVSQLYGMSNIRMFYRHVRSVDSWQTALDGSVLLKGIDFSEQWLCGFLDHLRHRDFAPFDALYMTIDMNSRKTPDELYSIDTCAKVIGYMSRIATNDADALLMEMLLQRLIDVGIWEGEANICMADAKVLVRMWNIDRPLLMTAFGLMTTPM